ncbi:hypothetical protein [Burkholderia cenocepacia]|uniref:hypothetical protein n=1 Tax=Burkholderia cenocepacia TaxID=95486 RepID=UPI000F5B23FA|nr:hypothetical protein [Burkholderia cenocepacia]
MNRQYGDSGAIVLVIFVAVVVVSLVARFSSILDLDFDVTLSMFFRFVMLACSIGVAWWACNQLNVDGVKCIAPVALALFWGCWWPALDFWAGQSEAGMSAMAYAPLSAADSTSVWWDSWYVKGGGLVGLSGVGYLLGWLCQRD